MSKSVVKEQGASSTNAVDQDEALTMTMHAEFGTGSVSAEPLGVGTSVGGVTFVPAPSGNFVVRDRLELRGLHSSGGIGEVWRAYDGVLEREVALKRLRIDREQRSTSRRAGRRGQC